METRSKDEIIIRVPKDAKEVTIDPAAKLAPSEYLKEIVHVNTVEDGTKDGPLSDAVFHSEQIRELANPSNIGHLIYVDKDY